MIEVRPSLQALDEYLALPATNQELGTPKTLWRMYANYGIGELFGFSFCEQTGQGELSHRLLGSTSIHLDFHSIRDISLEHYGNVQYVVLRFTDVNLSDLFFTARPFSVSWGNSQNRFRADDNDSGANHQ